MYKNNDTHDGERGRNSYRRRRLLTAVAAGGLAGFAGCIGGLSDGGQSDGQGGDDTTAGGGAGGTTSDGGGGGTSSGGCSPGYEKGNALCDQLVNSATSMRPFDAAGTAVPVQFDYPCGEEWYARSKGDSEDQFNEFLLVNVGVAGFGPDEKVGYGLQHRFVYTPVEKGFLDEERSSVGNPDRLRNVEYEYDGTTRTAMTYSNQYGTSAKLTVPFNGSLLRIDLSADVNQRVECSTDPYPDFDLVTKIIKSVEPNPDTTFSFRTSTEGTSTTTE